MVRQQGRTHHPGYRRLSRAYVSGLVACLAPTVPIAHASGSYATFASKDGVRIEIRTSGDSNVSAPSAHVVRVGEVQLVGVAPDVLQASEMRAGAIRGKIVPVVEIFALASAIESEHARAGYAFARAVVLPQTIRHGGPAQIGVVQLTIEGLDLDAVDEKFRARVVSRLQPLIGKLPVTTADLTRAVGLLQIELGTRLEVAPKPGSTPDRIRLAVSGAGRPLTGELSATRLTSDPFQQSMVSGAFTATSMAGLSERLSVAGTLGERHERPNIEGPFWAFASTAQIPLGEHGIFAEILGSSARELRRFWSSDYKVEYRYNKAGLRIGLPFIAGTGQIFIFKVGPDSIGERLTYRFDQAAWPAEAIQDFRTNVVRAGVTSYMSLPWGVSAQAGIEYSGGRITNRDVFGPPDPLFEQSPRRRDGASKLEGRFQFDVPLPAGFQASISGRGQYSFFGWLPPAEQMQLFTTEASLPLNPETSQGESGAVARAEIARTISASFISPGAVLGPYSFISGGFVSQKRGAGLDSLIVQGRKFGAGVKLSIPDPSGAMPVLEIGLECFRQVTDGPVPDHTGLTVRVATRF